MAILNHSASQVAVRIKRSPENTYFDEKAKSSVREMLDARSCQRYLATESGQAFTIEVTIKKGYIFGNAIGVTTGLYLTGDPNTRVAYDRVARPVDHEGGIKEDLELSMKLSDCIIGNQTHSGGKFVMNDLVIDKSLNKATNVEGFSLDLLGGFCVTVHREIIVKEDTDAQYRARVTDAIKKTRGFIGPHNWLIKTIDQFHYKDLGIASVINVTGGTWENFLPSRQNTLLEKTTILHFLFHCRQADFLARSNIVKHPLPLHYYSWVLLSEAERKTALQELQENSKQHARQEVDPKLGQGLSNSSSGIKALNSKALRTWGEMSSQERQEAFELLQNIKRQYERREVVRRQTNSQTSKVISLGDNDEDALPAGAPTDIAPHLKAGRSSTPIAKKWTRPSLAIGNGLEDMTVKDADLDRSSAQSPSTLSATPDSRTANGFARMSLIDFYPPLSTTKLAEIQKSAKKVDGQRTPKREREIKIGSIDADGPLTKRTRGTKVAKNPEANVIDEKNLEKLEAEYSEFMEELEEQERLAKVAKLKRKADAMLKQINAVKAAKGN